MELELEGTSNFRVMNKKVGQWKVSLSFSKILELKLEETSNFHVINIYAGVRVIGESGIMDLSIYSIAKYFSMENENQLESIELRNYHR